MLPGPASRLSKLGRDDVNSRSGSRQVATDPQMTQSYQLCELIPKAEHERRTLDRMRED